MKTRRLLFTVTLALGLTLALLWALGGNSPYVRAATFQVTNTASSGPGSLRQAMLDAGSNPGADTITFVSGLGGTIVLTAPLPTISELLTINGPGTQLAVSGNDTYRIFNIQGNPIVIITAITLRDGSADNGGGIWSSGRLHLRGVQLMDNTASGMGGGLYIAGGTATLSGTHVLNNAAPIGGGLYISHSTSTKLNNGTQVLSNTASQHGGGVYIASADVTLEMTGGAISNNTASLNGGGLYVQLGSATLDGTQVTNNRVSESGGGIYVDEDGAMLEVKNGAVNGNRASEGGGIYVYAGTAILRSAQVNLNYAGFEEAGAGGGLLIWNGAAFLHETQVATNSTVMLGGGVYVGNEGATLDMVGGEIRNNSTEDGGGLYIYSGAATLTGTQMLSNRAYSVGGAVYVDRANATLTISAGEINDNESDYGGGVYVNYGRATLNETHVLSNTVDQTGGGMYVDYGSVTLNETQVRDNHADVGGGLCLDSGSATLNITGGAINTNHALWYGGGLYIRQGDATLNGTQLLDNVVYGVDDFAPGGGIYISGGGATLGDTQIVANGTDEGSAIYQAGGTITPTTPLTITGNIYLYDGLFAGSSHDLRIEGALALAGGNFYAPYEPNVFVLTGAYVHTGGTYHQTKDVNGSSDVSFPKEGGLIINANAQDLGSTHVADTANVTCAGITPGNAVKHCYLITPTISTGRDATITFYYRSDEIPAGQSCAAMEAYRWTGAWNAMLTRDTSYGTDGRMCGSNPYSIRVVDVDVFSPFVIHEPKPADISVVPTTTLDFGDQVVDAGPTAPQTVLITNEGDFDLHITSVTLSGASGEFNLVDSGETTLPFGSTRTIQITFDPTSVGTKVALLRIESDDSDEPTVEVGLSGRGIIGYKVFLPLVLRGS